MLNSETLIKVLDELRERGGDSYDVEVKTGANGIPGLGQTLCAFANMPDGGTIIIGVSENLDFKVLGIAPSRIAKLEQGIAAQARDHIKPPPQLDFQTLKIGSKTILVATVHGLELASRPAFYKGVAYLRQADGEYPMSPQELQHIELLKTQGFEPLHPDRFSVPGASLTDLDASLLAAYDEALSLASRRFHEMSRTERLVYSGVLTPGGEATLGGLYALGKMPQAVTPSLGVTAAVQVIDSERGQNTTAGTSLDELARTVSTPRVMDLSHFTGPVPELLEQSLAWVERNTSKALVYDQHGHARDLPTFPLAAAREIIANALVHRSLAPITDSKRVEIRIRGSVLSVTSPGGLWGVTAERLGKPGGKSAVNPMLYEILKNVRTPDGARVIEGEGGGIREAIQVLEACGLPRPRFIDQGIELHVLMRLTPEPPRPAPIQQSLRSAEPIPTTSALTQTSTKHGPAILASLSDGPQTLNTIRSVTGLSEGQARYALGKLIAAGNVLMLGSQGDPDTTYCLQ